MKKIFAVLSLAALSTFAFAAISNAQESSTDVPAADAPAKDKAPEIQSKSLGDLWRAGGITMYPLGLFAVFGSTLIIYNFIAIRKKKFLNPEGVKSVIEFVNQMNIQGAIDYCEKHPSPITNILGGGLSRADEKSIDLDDVTNAMEESSVEEFANPYVLINYLSVIASLAPMLGLYGTVSGMVKAFNTIAAEGAGSASKLADNISEALITTAAGMIIGIPAMFFFFFFKNKYGAIISGSSRIIGDVIYTMKMSMKYGPQDLSAIEADVSGTPADVVEAADKENK